MFAEFRLVRLTEDARMRPLDWLVKTYCNSCGPVRLFRFGGADPERFSPSDEVFGGRTLILTGHIWLVHGLFLIVKTVSTVIFIGSAEAVLP